MQTTNENHFFQSDSQLASSSSRQAKAKETKNAKNVLSLPTKPLFMCLPDPSLKRNNEAWIADSGGAVRCIDLENSTISKNLVGHRGPATSLAFFKPKTLSTMYLISASWDKSFRIYNIETGKLVANNQDAHSDFIKDIVVIENILLTAGSDREIRFWDLTSLTEQEQEREQEPKPIKFLRTAGKEHTRPIEKLAWNYVTIAQTKNNNDEDDDDEYPDLPKTGSVCLWSTDTMGKVIVWELDDLANNLQINKKQEWIAHETGIYDIVIIPRLKQIWTASADNMANLSAFDPSDPTKPPRLVKKLEHSDYVRSVLPIPDVFSGLSRSYVITGSTDEIMRVWDLTSILEEDDDFEGDLVKKAQVKYQGANTRGLVNTVNVHFDEVNELKLWNKIDPTNGKIEPIVLSMSLDATLRTWKLSDIVKKQQQQTQQDTNENKSSKKESSNMLTEEEERELAELMDD